MSERKDIGLLTWHFVDNVGSNLQAYAMYRLVTELGYSAEFLNYRREQPRKAVRMFLKRSLGILDSFVPDLLPARFRSRDVRFQEQYFPQTKLIRHKEDFCKYRDRYRMFLCGSDQIWAPNILDSSYLFSFLSEDEPRFAYAASVGLNQIPLNLRETYVKYLSRFRKITVREKQGAGLIGDLLGTDIDWALDPTFLIEKEHWTALARIPKERNYIFCYFLGENMRHRELAEQVAEKYGMKVICLSFRNEAKRANWNDMSYMGPKEFLGYILNSKFVLTDSFHGMALSINLGKDFYVFERHANDDPVCQNSRIYNILSAFHLESRLAKEEVSELVPVDYEMVRKEYRCQKERSKMILRAMLKEGCGY